MSTSFLIFICSKGRYDRTSATWEVLYKAGVPCTVVVEPNEQEAYLRATTKFRSLVSVKILPASNQGIGFSRHCVLRRFAEGGKFNIMMDDDITDFGEVTKKPLKFQIASASVVLRKFADASAKMQKDDPSIVLFGMNQTVWCARSKKISVSENTGGCNVVVGFDPSKIPQAIDYRIDIHEDRDFALQVLAAGLQYRKFNHFSYTAPMMGKAGKGGLTPIYKDKKEVEKQNEKFLSLWPANIVYREMNKEDNNGLHPIAVKWKNVVRGTNQALQQDSVRQMCLRSRIAQLDSEPPRKKKRLE